MSAKTKSKSGGCGCGGSKSCGRGSGGCGCGGGCGHGGCGCGGAACGQADCRTGAPGAGGYVRPRFFAGQLLTEDDLQALTQYVTDKNRLHNRHFVGAGVVCGLAVTCAPCGGGTVVVNPGHAVDCCGNDIVLECQQELNLPAMIREFRRARGHDCVDPCEKPTPPGRAPPDATGNQGGDAAGAGGADQASGGAGASPPPGTPPSRHYCLYVRYCEQEAEPVTPYAADEPCGASACQATRVREGFRFELRCRCEEPAPDTFLGKFLACAGEPVEVEKVVRTTAGPPGEPPDAAKWLDALTSARASLLDRIEATTGATRCDLYRRVTAIPFPGAGESDAAKRDEALRRSAVALRAAAIEHYLDCACRALLPPCPPPCADPAVLLACIEVRECEVVSICNVERTFALTWPAMRYWLPAHPLSQVFEKLCCAGALVGGAWTEEGRAAQPAPGEPASSRVAVLRPGFRNVTMPSERELIAALGDALDLSTDDMKLLRRLAQEFIWKDLVAKVREQEAHAQQTLEARIAKLEAAAEGQQPAGPSATPPGQ